MVNNSLLKHLLRDDESLSSYINGHSVTYDDVKRRMFLLERSENKVIPDHYYRLVQEKTFEGLHTLGDVLRIGLFRLGREHLHMRGNRIHVLQLKQNAWQQLITYMPPLVLQAAFLHLERPIPDLSVEGVLKYFREVLLPNMRYTALPYPYIQQLEHFIKESSGLHDLHMHLSGTTETDMVWQDFLFAPDKIYDELKSGYKKAKVREQLEQESHLFSPAVFHRLLGIAQRIRVILFDFIFPVDTEKYRNRSLESLMAEVLRHDGEGRISGNYQHPFRNLVSVDDDYPHLMGVEGLMYVLVFRYMAHEPRESVASLFHFYLLILGLSNRLMVQQTHQYGFEQFQKHTLNGLRETSEKEYGNLFLQLLGNDLRNIRFLEGRFSPKPFEKDCLSLLNAIEAGWHKLTGKIEALLVQRREEKEFNSPVNLPELRLIGHFIKQEDREPDPFIRHKVLRKDIWQRALVLSLILQNYPKYKKLIIGVDAAANEFDAPPEVFGPVFRMLRRKGVSHFTYHAGEDYFHLISGLRAIYEAIEFTGLKNGDRIGHATATGISASQWAGNMGGVIPIRQGEWLDNLIFAYHLIITEDISSLRQHVPVLTNEIQKLATNVYKTYYPLKALEDAWLSRRFCPIQMFSRDRASAEHTSVFDSEEWDDIRNVRQQLGDEADWLVILQRYHSGDCRKEYDKIIQVKADEVFSLSDLEVLQQVVLKLMHRGEIIIETLPTSNVRIGHHHSYSTYHLWNWMQWEEEGKAIPPIVVGTDDTGIFATNIYNEYANIYCHLISLGETGHTKAMGIIEKLEKNSKIYRFE